jgi:hypothetical protein
MKNNEPKAMQEVHEIQEKIYEQEKNLTTTERIYHANQIADEMLKRYPTKCKRQDLN